MEQKYGMGTEDGSVQILWDIGSLAESLERGNYPVERRGVRALCEANTFHGDSSYAMETDIDRPCIIAELAAGFEKLIDGNHRLCKAEKLGVDSLPCYVLPKEYHIRFIVDYDPEKYHMVVGDVAG